MGATGHARLVEIVRSNERLFRHRDELWRERKRALARDDFLGLIMIGEQLSGIEACLRINLGEAAEIAGPDRVSAMGPALAHPFLN